MIFNRSLLRSEAGRLLIAISFVCSPIVAIVGDTQKGKSTFNYWLSNEICRIKAGLGLMKNPYWDWKNLTARSFEQFKELVRTYKNNVIVIEEAGTHLDADEWWTLENKLYNKIVQTQAFRRNVYILVCPSSRDIAKKHRATLNMMFSVERKNVRQRRAMIKPNFIKKKHWLLRDRNYVQYWLNRIAIEYDREFLIEAKKYTDWLEGYKDEILDGIDDRYDDYLTKDKIELKRPKARSVAPIEIIT